MKLRSREKQQAKTRDIGEEPRSIPEILQREGLSETLYIRCNALLYNTIQNMVLAAHTAQDFTHGSPADVIRSALCAYRDGMTLSELDASGEKIPTTIRIDKQTKGFYASLPDRLRTKLLERAIRTYLKQQL